MPASTNKVVTFLALVSNICISVIIVLLNKWIFQSFKFPNITLTCIHFLVTASGMEIARRMDVFLVKSLPLKDMVMLSASFCGFVVLTNLSLQANTVGTYQISKFMTTPCIILLQTCFYNKRFSKGIMITLVSYSVDHCQQTLMPQAFLCILIILAKLHKWLFFVIAHTVYTPVCRFVVLHTNMFMYISFKFVSDTNMHWCISE